MQDLILITLIVGLSYYLLIHQQEKPLTNSQFTQTEPISTDNNKSLEKTVDTLIHNIHHLNHQIK